jgi:cyclase
MRRTFFSLAVLSLSTLLAAQAASRKPYPPMDGFSTIKVAEGVVAFISPEPSIPLVSGTSVAVIGDDGVLVVDTGHFPSLTRKMIAEIRKLTDKPVRYVVTTHWHADHVTGNSTYRDAFPDAVFVSTPWTRTMLVNPLPQYDDVTQIEGFVPVLKQMLASGKTPSGRAISEEERATFQAMVDISGDALAEFRQARRTPPTVTFKDELVLYLGKREVQVRFAGRGNTAGDAFVYVPDGKVLITGDLLVHPVPYAYGPFFTEWIETLKTLDKIDATSIVPGHGPVQHDKVYLERVIALLQDTVTQVGEAVKGGATLPETRKALNLEKHRVALCGEAAVCNQFFRDSYLAPGIARAYREAKEGRLTDEN